jgi:hypothetical protein
LNVGVGKVLFGGENMVGKSLITEKLAVFVGIGNAFNVINNLK